MTTPRAAAATLTEVEDQFVDLWRTMSALWGVSPTMAQIHGLLFIAEAPLSVDDVMSRLGISRGNVSMNVAKLIDWGLVRRVHRKGDRRDYYESVGDVWEMFTRIAAQRKRREIDPMLDTLRRCRAELATLPTEESVDIAGRARRVDELVAFLSMVDRLAQRFFESQVGLRAAVERLAQDEAP